MLVVGAGAAGIIAAWRAATKGARVTLLEKTTRIGTKVLISGGGKCNLTHDGPIEGVLKAFRPNEALFLRPSFYRFPPEDFLKIVTSRGLRVMTRPDGRIFPVDQTAKDVVHILAEVLDQARVDVRLESPVTSLMIQNRVVGGVVTREESIEADAVVIACGGNSYPNSGTTGDGWVWMREAGHSIVPLRAALAPIYLDQCQDSGLALRDVVLRSKSTRWRGDLLFTHHGISGPCALGISRDVAEAMESGKVPISIDSYPDDTYEALNLILINHGRQFPNRLVITALTRHPDRYVERVLCQAQVPLAAKLKDLDKKARNRLVEALKSLPLGPARAIPLEKGEVVAGGVSLDEVDPKTMQSKLIRRLYLCGEILDIAGPVGGYNLQAAWSTGYVAADNARHESVE